MDFPNPQLEITQPPSEPRPITVVKYNDDYNHNGLQAHAHLRDPKIKELLASLIPLEENDVINGFSINPHGEIWISLTRNPG